MASADRQILDLVETNLLDTTVWESTAARVINWASGRGREATARRAELVAALATLDAELQRLTAALAGGGDFATIVQGISQREQAKASLLLELKTLGTDRIDRVDVTRFKSIVAHYSEKARSDWETNIRRHIPQARSMLTKLLRGRLTVTPEERDGVPGFRFRGEGSVLPALAGWIPDFPKGGASPTGTEPYPPDYRLLIPAA